jgi:hypothetical protein
MEYNERATCDSYSDMAGSYRASYRPLKLYNLASKLGPVEWEYHRKQREALSYEGLKPFSGPYTDGKGYSGIMPKIFAGKYKKAA